MPTCSPRMMRLRESGAWKLKTMMGMSLSRQRDKGGAVHDAEAQVECFEVFESRELFGIGVGLGVGFVNAIDAILGHQDDVGGNFDGAQGGGCVGREIGVAGACGKDDNAAFFEVPQCASANVGFGDGLDG